jgi:hypothetical protein
MIDEAAFAVSKDGATIFGYTFPEKGIYLQIKGTEYDAASFTTTENVEYMKRVPKQIDEKFIPSEVIYKPDDILYAGAFSGADIKYLGDIMYAISEDNVVLSFGHEVPKEFANYYESDVRVVVFPYAKKTGAYVGGKHTVKVVLPKVEILGSQAFRSCIALQSIVLPSATEIGSQGFYNCHVLATVDLPRVTSIATQAFDTCYQLKALILRSKVMCTLAKNVFSANYHMTGTKESTHNPEGLKDGYIYVPRALLSDTDATKDYRRAKNWSTFETQFRVLEDYTVDGTITGELDPSKI